MSFPSGEEPVLPRPSPAAILPIASGCGAGGTIFRFIIEYEHVDFPDAVRKLAHRAGIPIVEEEGSAEEDDRHRLRKHLLALHADASAWFHKNLLKSPLAQRLGIT